MRDKKSKVKIYALVLFVFPVLFMFGKNIFGANIEDETENQEESDAPELEATSAVLIDAKKGIIIYEKNKDTTKYPASITKILTALLVIEKTELDERVVFSHDAVFSLPYNSSHIAMDEEESLSIEQCLYAILLESANEVSNAVAEHIENDNAAFAELMNKRAKEIGAVNTHFANPHGLHDENHYTTAYDMALIMKEAIKQPEFIKVIGTRSLSLPPTEKQPESRPLNNGHKMISPGHPYYSEYVVGGKTGYTTQAGNTLVTYAKKDDMELIAVVLQNSSSNNAYIDTTTLLDYGFEKYGFVKIFDHERYTSAVAVPYKKDDTFIEIGTINIEAKDSMTDYLPTTLSHKDLDIKPTLSPDLVFPISVGDEIGFLDVIYKNEVLDTVPIFSKTALELPKTEEEQKEEEQAIAAFKNEKKDNFLNGAKGIGFTLLKIIGVIIGILLIIAISARVYRYIKRKNKKKARRKAVIYHKQRGSGNRKDVKYRNYRYR